MADQDIETTDTPNAAPRQERQLEGGSYEIIRARLAKQGEDLSGRLDRLNELRRLRFPSTGSK